MYLSQLFSRYENVVPQLTARENNMLNMYERLTGMLLRMDLGDEHALDFWDRDKEKEASADDGGPKTPKNVKVEGAGGADPTLPKITGDAPGGGSSDGGGTSLGKRKHDDGSASKGEVDTTADSGATGAMNADLDSAMQNALYELLELAAEIGSKEREE